MGVKVAFQAETDTTAGPRLLVPRAALGREGETTVAFVVRDGSVERRAVTPGREAGSDVEVRAGLREGEIVVMSPPAELADGDPVKSD
jgi:multidrug efflux pump subunit AcrA (membrane-fusion protein)